MEDKYFIRFNPNDKEEYELAKRIFKSMWYTKDNDYIINDNYNSWILIAFQKNYYLTSTLNNIKIKLNYNEKIILPRLWWRVKYKNWNAVYKITSISGDSFQAIYNSTTYKFYFKYLYKLEYVDINSNEIINDSENTLPINNKPMRKLLDQVAQEYLDKNNKAILKAYELSESKFKELNALNQIAFTLSVQVTKLQTKLKSAVNESSIEDIQDAIEEIKEIDKLITTELSKSIKDFISDNTKKKSRTVKLDLPIEV